MCQLRVAPFYVLSMKFQRGGKSNSEKKHKGDDDDEDEDDCDDDDASVLQCVCANQNPGKIFRFECATTLIFYISFFLLLLLHTMRASVCSCVCIVIHDVCSAWFLFYFLLMFHSLLFIFLLVPVTVAAAAALPLLLTAIVDSFLFRAWETIRWL